MPNFTSHVIMASQLYDKCSDEKDFYVDITRSKMCQYAIGQDYTFSKVSLFNKTHTKRSQAFFYYLCKFIHDNKLYNNPDVMDYLYGQIAHFAFDTSAHNTVYSVEYNPVDGIYTPHMVIEFYYDSHLAKKIEHLNFKEATMKYFNDFIMFTDIVKILIEQVYYETYGEKNAALYYKVTQATLKKLLGVLNSYVKGTTVYEKCFDAATKNIDPNHFLNDSHEQLTNPFDGSISTDSLDDRYEQSIDRASKMIKNTNEYLYEGKSIDSVVDSFPDISYDTGIACNLGKKVKYLTRNMKKNKISLCC